jgi:hypothetical protein
MHLSPLNTQTTGFMPTYLHLNLPTLPVPILKTCLNPPHLALDTTLNA